MSGDQDFDQRLAAGVNDGVRRIDQKINRASLPRAVQAIACRGILLFSGPLTKASRSALGYGEKISWRAFLVCIAPIIGILLRSRAGRGRAITGHNNIFCDGEERHGYSQQLAMVLVNHSRTHPSFKKPDIFMLRFGQRPFCLALHSFLRYWKRDLRHTRFLEIGLEREPDAVPAKYGWRKFGDER